MICPICRNEECHDLIVDLLICYECNHIFKKEMNKYEVKKNELPFLQNSINPVEQINEFIENNEQYSEFIFVFPSMVFETLELHPGKFYEHGYNHYFNQNSIMILLDRCDLMPVYQENKQQGKYCITTIKAIKRGIKNEQ